MSASSSGKPNILIIVTDQQRRDTVGAYGSEICKTPSMDRLAAEGLRFDNAYTPTGLCSPVRGSFFSGVFPHAHKVLTNTALHPIREGLKPEADMLTGALKQSGYHAGYVGKWHVNNQTPIEFGFDDYISLGDFSAWRDEIGIAAPAAMSHYTTQIAAIDPAPVDKSRPAYLCDNAMRLIDQYTSEGNRPFFLRLDFHGPHFPNVVPQPYFSMYDPASIPPWPNFDDKLEGKPAVQKIKQRHWGTDRYEWSDWQPLVSAYFGEITLIDSQVGRVLEHLDAHGLCQDTLVIWTTDHGDTIGAHNICNKDYTMYEEIYAVPLLIRWPQRVKAGTVSDRYVHHFLDIFATLRDLTDGDPGAKMHGRSLFPVFDEQDVSDRPRDAFCQFHGSHMGLYSMRLLTDDDYAYIYHTNDIDEFYDRRNDPWQLNNLSENPGPHGDAFAARRRRMVAWMALTDDHLHNEWTVLWLTGDAALAAEAPGRRRTKW